MQTKHSTPLAIACRPSTAYPQQQHSTSQSHKSSTCTKIQAGTANRDCFLTPQDIRNINSKLAPLIRKKHQNEAQSVRLFYEQHASNIFIYQEQINGQSNVPAVDIQPADLEDPYSGQRSSSNPRSLSSVCPKTACWPTCSSMAMAISCCWMPPWN